jgi:protein-S-isoprenylcysteine O-methyltransferase Ste14
MLSMQDLWQKFCARGGGWVVAQIFVLAALVLIPIRTGATRNAFAFEHPLAWLGAAAVAGGIVLGIAAMFSLGRALTPFPRPRDEALLVTKGVYGWVRHPIYAGLLLAALGWSLWWASPAGGVTTLLAAVFFDRKAAREERWLEARFPAYRDYRRQVKKFIPGIY